MADNNSNIDNNVDDIKELEEHIINPDGTFKFISYKAFTSVDEGFILVRKTWLFNHYSISLRDKRKLEEAKKSAPIITKNCTVKVVDLSDSELKEQINKVKHLLEDANITQKNKAKAERLLKILKQEKKYREDSTYQRHPAVLETTISVKKKAFKNSTISAIFSGTKFRWFFHPTAIRVPLRKTILDLKEVKSNVVRTGESVSLDVDFAFTIVDPVKFMRLLNTQQKTQ